ncbi:unnamed protein product [Darwinula stevensoni]|uniref:Condensin complex subunit 1 n=1 Tax=Darwinula stevensoni TaxID=69355 RepID=A0A7R9FRM4_9CRUS|nr:unnamed protein product [Darwinula stevensoni]CAG0901703.1 unnamed protein product [Darwinula stevensoni]
MEFVIPVTRDGLKCADSAGHYVVEEFFNVKELPYKIRDAFSSAKRSADFIEANFDVLYGGLENFSHLSLETKEDAWNCISIGMQELISELHQALDPEEPLDGDVQLKYRNMLKMLIYLMVQYIYEYEAEDARNIRNDIGKGRGRGKVKASEEPDFWPRVKDRALHLLYEVACLPLHLLWNTPLVDEDFIRWEPTMLQYFESSVIPLAQGLVHVSQDLEGKMILGELVREIGRMDVGILARDTSTTKHYAQFITEVANISPDLLIPSMTFLVPLLECEPYTVRSAVLEVMGEIVGRVLCAEGLEKKERKLRDEFLEYLLDHMCDVNAFVRAKASFVMQVWGKLSAAGAIPLKYQPTVLNKAIRRVSDKAATVRKNAIQLIMALLQGNPYAAALPIDDVQKQLAEETKKLQAMEEEYVSKEKARSDALSDPAQLWLEMFPHVLEAAKEHLEEGNKENFPDSLEFALRINQAIPALCDLLSSEQTSDVFETIDFFVVAMQFQFEQAITGVRRMLNLVWSKEKSIQEAVLKAYRTLYFEEKEGKSARSNAGKVVSHLIKLASSANLGELVSLENLIVELVRAGDINKQMLQILWERFTRAQPGITEQESRTALQLLAMAGSANPGIIATNLQVLMDVGLGPGAKENHLLPWLTCKALLKLQVRYSGRTVSKDGEELSPRMPPDHKLFQLLQDLLVDEFLNEKDVHYTPMALEAINVIYKLSDLPHQNSSVILKGCQLKVFSKEEKLCSLPLARLLSMVGHVALKQKMFLMNDVFQELKRRDAAREETGKDRTKRITSRASRASRVSNPANVSSASMLDGDQELGMLGATAHDSNFESVKEECEGLLYSGYLGHFRGLVVEICSKLSQYTDKRLKTAACDALGKFMLTSSRFCEDHIQLFFTILEKSDIEEIRGNSVLYCRDLMIQYPNVLAPWTPYIYRRLHDTSNLVKKQTLRVLNELVLSDMIKVRGQISDVALCIMDPDPGVSNAARLFFVELAGKGNSVYNVLPDIISRLSDAEVGTSEEHFQNILNFIITVTQKEKQMDGLVEKLVNRFPAATTERQWRDMAYCLSLLNYGEKSLKKLQENLPCYAKALSEPKVYEHFVKILTGCKKFIKPDMKRVMEEFEAQIKEFHEKGLDDVTASKRARDAVRRQSNRNTPKTPRSPTKQRTRRQLPSSSSEDEEEESEEEDEVTKSDEVPVVRKNPRERKRGGKKNEEEIQSGSDAEDFQPPSTKKTQPLSTKKTRPLTAKKTRPLATQNTQTPGRTLRSSNSSTSTSSTSSSISSSTVKKRILRRGQEK